MRMRMFNAAIAGLLTGFLLYFLAALALPKTAFYVFIPGTVLFAYLFYHNSWSIGQIWSKACLIAAVECLALPLASWILPHIYGQEAVMAAQLDAQRIGESLGAALGGALINLLTSHTGILIGILLLVIAYISIRPARRRC
ncbi:MAG: hypothetical protein GX325_06300 [Peptococcaceae bacterium]|nr:hypothetical protein [Peptococcaceae bacterium]